VRKVLLVGAGGHAQVVADVLLEMRSAGKPVTPIGYVDDDERLRGLERMGLPILGTRENLASIDFDELIVAIGNNSVRLSILRALIAEGYQVGSAVHPSAVISRSAHIGPGAMVCAGAVVNPESTVGSGVILNTACSVDHHNRLGDGVHIAPGARLGGSVSVGDTTLIGIGAVVLPSLMIGTACVVAGGAVVTTNVKDGVRVSGVPARPMPSRSRI